MANKESKRLLRVIPLQLSIVTVVFLLALALASLLAYFALNQQPDLFDERVIRFFHSHASATVINLMEKITVLGSSTVLLPAYLLVIILHLLKKRYAYALDIAIIGISSTALLFGLKTLFHRHRPSLPVLKGVSGYSFPSGHALSGFIFCTLLFLLVRREVKNNWLKNSLCVFLIILPIVIGLSRVILNVHYATDVLGGFCVAIVWVIICLWLFRKLRARKQSQPL